MYDTLGLGDEVPDPATGRVQLDLFVCAPFGDYELELVVQSSTDDDAPEVYQRRSAWEIENGEDEVKVTFILVCGSVRLVRVSRPVQSASVSLESTSQTQPPGDFCIHIFGTTFYLEK